MSDKPPQKSSASPGRAAIASLIGTAIEWYDFFVYSTAAVLVFNVHFFPGFDPATGTLLAFSTFTAGFIARPIGAIVFGHFGDRVGRKSMMVLTISIMGIATVLIGLLPTYAEIGVAAPIILVVLRLTQGFALGGEWGGAALMATEHAPAERRGYFGSWAQAGLTVGLVLALTVFLPLNALSEESFLSWGWRIPFLLSAVLVLIGLAIRVKVSESPEFDKIKETSTVTRLPILEVLRNNYRQVLLIAGAAMAPGILFYLLAVYNFVYVAETGISRTFMQVLVIVTSIIGFAVIPIAGMLSDRYGRQLIYLTGLALIAVVAAPLYWALDTGATAYIVVFYVVATVAVYLPYALQPSFFSVMFDPKVRYSGLSLGITLGHLVGSAIAPLVAGTLVQATGTSTAIAAYLLAATAISAVSVLVLERDRRRSLRRTAAIGSTDNSYLNRTGPSGPR